MVKDWKTNKYLQLHASYNIILVIKYFTIWLQVTQYIIVIIKCIQTKDDGFTS